MCALLPLEPSVGGRGVPEKPFEPARALRRHPAGSSARRSAADARHLTDVGIFTPDRWSGSCRRLTMPAWVTIDGNEAAASVAHRTNEVIAIYPITPSSTMGELADEWSAAADAEHLGRCAVGHRDAVGGRRHCRLPRRAAGRVARHYVHGEPGPAPDDPQPLQDRGGADAFLPARRCAHRRHARALDLRRPLGRDGVPADRRGDARSASVQEAHDFALIGQAATLASRMPFLHFFDGFRTSHEVAKIRAAVRRRPARACCPTRSSPPIGSAPSRRTVPCCAARRRIPDTFFQAREASAPFHTRLPGHRAAHDGRVRGAHRPAVPPVRLRGASGGRARRGPDGVRRRHGGRGRGMAPGARANGRRAEGAALPPVLGGRFRERPARDHAAPSPCWIARRSPAPWASRSTRTSSRRCTMHAWRAGRSSPATSSSSAAATGCRRRNSRRPWRARSSTSCTSRGPRTTSRSASSTT